LLVPYIRRIVAFSLTALICCGFAAGQGADPRLEFEAASVKPAPPYHGEVVDRRGGPGTSDPRQVIYPRAWLPGLVAEAYGVRADQVSGPDWVQTEAYSIVANIPPKTTKQEFNLMLRNLLAERFHLALRHDPKLVSVYVLSVAPGGPKLKPSPVDADAPFAPARFPPLSPGKTVALWWRDRAYYTYRQTMAEFAFGLGPLVNMSNGDGIVRGSPPMPFVVDETGIKGRFDFTLEFAGSPIPSAAVAAALAGQQADPAALAPTVAGLDIFRALQQQLGLKLEKGKRTVDFLIIEHADRIPTEN
jgi:uncharacterized protein (TIGR03435 family)